MSGVRIVLLCEDKKTDSFVRSFLRHRNFRGRDITTLALPAGRQAGEQWVREKYPKELKTIRQKHGAYLIVVTDADSGSTEDRREKLRSECNLQKVQPRNEKDPVLEIIPRRNIETWLAYLDGSNVDEHTNYKWLNHQRHCREHAKRLYNMCHREQKLREPAPPSLKEACEEYSKLEK